MVDPETAIHLSVVATSRNDNHGGSLTRRMQHFVDGFVAQCKRHDLRAELILVEWNPPEDRKPLIQELRWPEHLGPCEIRIITVPPEIHRTFEHHEKLPLFQMIAKNVGIRRARGKFVLATNIDILFSDEVIRYMRDRLKPGRLYRTTRCDIPSEIPQVSSFEELLAFCRREMFRVHANGVTAVRSGPEWTRTRLLWLRTDPRLRYALLLLCETVRRTLRTPGWLLRRAVSLLVRFVTNPRSLWRSVRQRVHRLLQRLPLLQRTSGGEGSFILRLGAMLTSRLELIAERLIRPWPFTNACGDFTLLPKDDWLRLRGYPEWNLYSWHLDSVLLYQARAHGLREITLRAGADIYHIEHGVGSGFTPEAADTLFSRLKTSGIPFLTDQDLANLAREMRVYSNKNSVVTYNTASWGLAEAKLPEISIAGAHKASAGAGHLSSGFQTRWFSLLT